MWRYVVSDDGKVTDIYFLTQLTPDEKVSMVSPSPCACLLIQTRNMPVRPSPSCHFSNTQYCARYPYELVFPVVASILQESLYTC